MGELFYGAVFLNKTYNLFCNFKYIKFESVSEFFVFQVLNKVVNVIKLFCSGGNLENLDFTLNRNNKNRPF